ncbi:MAG: hypothetical protein ACT4OF_13910 [Caulobacteraceae bacterium]
MAETDGRVSAPGRICSVAAEFGLKLADDAEIREGRSITARLISDAIASPEVFSRVQAITRASVFVYREGRAVTGMLGLFLLRPAGLRAIEAGDFDAVNPDYDLIARPGEFPAACYGWGFAGTTNLGGGAAVKAAVALRDRLFWRIPVITRTATEDGVRVILGKMGYQKYSDSDPTLVWMPPSAEAPKP